MTISFEDNKGLVHHVMRKMRNQIPECEKDDCEQEAMIALWKATQSFRPDAGAKFSTYACRAIYINVRRYLDQKHYKHPHMGSVVYANDGSERCLSDTEEPFQSVIDAEDVDRVRIAMDLLNEKHANVVRHMYGLDGKEHMCMKSARKASGVGGNDNGEVRRSIATICEIVGTDPDAAYERTIKDCKPNFTYRKPSRELRRQGIRR